MKQSDEISDGEAMFWLDATCLSFRIGNEKRQFQAHFNVSVEGGMLEAAKLAMLRFREMDEAENAEVSREVRHEPN